MDKVFGHRKCKSVVEVAPLNHSHGNVTYDGKLGKAGGKIVTTSDGGAMTPTDPGEVAKLIKTAMLDMVYPVGSIYMSVNETPPASLIGGTWERIQDVFLLAAGETFEAGTTGGEAEHTLTIDEMPSHGHDMMRPKWYTSDETLGNEYGAIGEPTATTYTVLSENTVRESGGSQPHNNMPPYLAVYVWKRTA